MTTRCIVFVHAHPDDEALGTGGTMARYSDEGAHVCLITCTNGELGEVADLPEIGPELGDRARVAARLGEIRIAELKEACRRLGTIDLRPLGFHDSGMQGTSGNADPRAFINQDIDDAVKKIVAVIRDVRPHVLVTYNEFGFYGHPDHIRAHDAAMLAIDKANDPSYEPASGRPHEVAKIYHTAVPKSLLRMARTMGEQLGAGSDDFFSEADVEQVGTDDERITTELDVARLVDRKFSALEAHRTQLGTTARFLQIPPEVRSVAMGTEHYVLVRSTAPAAEGREHDLFEGLGV